MQQQDQEAIHPTGFLHDVLGWWHGVNHHVRVLNTYMTILMVPTLFLLVALVLELPRRDSLVLAGVGVFMILDPLRAVRHARKHDWPPGEEDQDG